MRMFRHSLLSNDHILAKPEKIFSENHLDRLMKDDSALTRQIDITTIPSLSLPQKCDPFVVHARLLRSSVFAVSRPATTREIPHELHRQINRSRVPALLILCAARGQSLPGQDR
jgi:hypothetical protein